MSHSDPPTSVLLPLLPDLQFKPFRGLRFKVTRSDLLGALCKPAKRAAYLALAGAVWYVLGEDAKGRPIAQAQEVPAECGVLQLERGSLVVARSAPRRTMEHLPFHVWMALAQASPHIRLNSDEQAML